MNRPSLCAGMVLTLTLMVACRSVAPPPASSADLSEVCSVRIEAQGTRFSFVNPKGVATIRTVGSLEEAIRLRRTTEGVAAVRVRRVSRWTGGVTYPLTWDVPQTIWASVKQPEDSWNAVVPAGSYQVEFRYVSPSDDRVACEVVSAAIDLPESRIVTTD